VEDRVSTLQAIIYLLGLGYHFVHYLDLLRNNREEADKLGYPWGLVVAAVALLAVLWPLTELARAQHVPTSGRGKERCVRYQKRRPRDVSPSEAVAHIYGKELRQ